MQGVKKLHQESENVSKGEHIFGHLFGAIGILAGTRHKWFCLPLFINFQDGEKPSLTGLVTLSSARAPMLY